MMTATIKWVKVRRERYPKEGEGAWVLVAREDGTVGFGTVPPRWMWDNAPDPWQSDYR